MYHFRTNRRDIHGYNLNIQLFEYLGWARESARATDDVLDVGRSDPQCRCPVLECLALGEPAGEFLVVTVTGVLTPPRLEAGLHPIHVVTHELCHSQHTAVVVGGTEVVPALSSTHNDQEAAVTLVARDHLLLCMQEPTDDPGQHIWAGIGHADGALVLSWGHGIGHDILSVKLSDFSQPHLVACYTLP